jgi:hypothetical protein
VSPSPSLAGPPEDLSGFPAHQLAPGQVLARIHRADRKSGFYSSDGSGRFDLPLPHGTCYLGEEPLASFVEVFREAAVVAEALVNTKVLSFIQLPDDVRLADVTAPKSRRFGVTGEIHTSTAYGITQAWAAALHRAGFDGIRYLVRHDPSQRLTGVALFGPGGEHEDQFLTVETAAVPTSLVTAAEARFGIVILPTP